MKPYLIVFLAMTGLTLLLAPAAGALDYQPVAQQAELKASFADPAWDGKMVPKGSQCQRFGGKMPMSPAIKVSGIPQGADVIVLEYSDQSYAPMDNGGHGQIGYHIPSGAASVTLPAVPGHSYELPQGVFIIQEHQAPGWDKAGAYMPPCSGGMGNWYYLTIKALAFDKANPGGSKQLGSVRLEMGEY